MPASLTSLHEEGPPGWTPSDPSRTPHQFKEIEVFNVIERNATPAEMAQQCRACGRDGLTRLEAEHRVHEYCRSKLGPAWRLPKKAS